MDKARNSLDLGSHNKQARQQIHQQLDLLNTIQYNINNNSIANDSDYIINAPDNGKNCDNNDDDVKTAATPSSGDSTLQIQKKPSTISMNSTTLILDQVHQQQRQLLHLKQKQHQQHLLLLTAARRQQQQQQKRQHLHIDLKHSNLQNNDNLHHHFHSPQSDKPSIIKFVKKTKNKFNWLNCFLCLSHKGHGFSNSTLAQICQDWLFLALLGIIMALLSFSMDSVITLFLRTRLWLYRDISGDNVGIQYIGWCTMPIILVAFSTGFVHVFSPAAVGSGIPEMKTILRGVILNEYLTFRTLIGKIVGLTFTLGSGLPLGKEGPFVHMASIVATLLSKLVASFQGIYENESRTSEMLSAACAVGVAATFYAPIGGVLFSIEITTVYFAVRNYWRGFFAACCGATIWRLLSFWIKNDESISAIFKTNFKPDFPFDPIELVAFSFIGATCGLAGAAYIKFHREIVQIFRRHRRLSEYLHKNRFVYPIVVTFIITTVTFPPFLGKYTASTLSTHDTIEQLFSNKTWSLDDLDLETETMLNDWTTPNTGFHLHLILYIIMKFWTSALASTIPIPSGLFIPVLKMGAAYGRLLGEIMAQLFPDGIHYGDYVHPASIVPGSYAVVGAAAFSGAVTHTISTSVILFEMTGQIVHIIPVILAVLIANAVCQSLQPSIYDSIIEIKKLPYLPPIASSNSVSHKILVRDFMTQKIAFIWKDRCTYKDLKTILKLHRRVNSFPLVQSPETMILLGSIPRVDLLKLLYLKLGREQRLQEFRRRTSVENQHQATHKHLVSVVSGNQSNHLHNNDNNNNGQVHHHHHHHQQKQQQHQQSMQQPNLNINENDSTTTNSSRSTSNTSSSVSTVAAVTDKSSCIQINGKTLDVNDTNKIPLQQHQKHENDERKSSSEESTNLKEKRKSQLKRVPCICDDNNDIINGQQQRTENDKDEKSVELDPLELSRTSIARSINLYNKNSTVDYQNHDADQDALERALDGFINHKDTNNNKFQKNIDQQQVDPTQTTSESSLSVDARVSPTRSILKSGITDYSMRPSELSVQENIETASHRRRLRSLSNNKAITINNNNENIQRKKRSVRLPRLRVIDTTPEEQEEWEKEQLRSYVDFSRCQVDAAPFQLVEQTSLYRVHTLFSMLGLNHAYVTSVGRLVGIVALRDIRHAIEDMNNGEIHSSRGVRSVSSTPMVLDENHHTSTDEELYSRV